MAYVKKNWQNTPSTNTPVNADNLNHMEQGIYDAAETADYAKDKVDDLQGLVYSPLVAATAAAMTDTTKVYVYTGSETGYTSGHWYYYNGTAWADGGVYNSTAFNTDATLSHQGEAADAKATGDAIGNLNNALTTFENKVGDLDISIGYKTMEVGIIKKNGTIDATNTSYVHTPPIPVIEGALYGEFRAMYLESGYYDVWAYDENGDPVSGVYAKPSSPTENVKVSMTVPSGAKFIRFMLSASAYSNNPNFFFSQSLHGVDKSLDGRISALENKAVHYDDIEKIMSYTSVSMFNSVGVIGDSFSSGAVANSDGDAVVNCYPISWVQILARKAGFEGINYSSTGSDVSRFLYTSHPTYSQWNMAKLESDPARDVYIIVLGINAEKSKSDSHVEVSIGTTADINKADYTQNADTFCGHYGEMLSRIIAHAPTAKIICVVPWNRKGTDKGNAIISVAQLYDLPYFCMDDSSYYGTDFWRNTRELQHPIGVTYAGMAVAFQEQIQKCMIDNVTYFADYRPQVS